MRRQNQLDAKDLEIIKSIFDGKTMTIDSPSCGFTENVSIVFNDSDRTITTLTYNKRWE